MVFFAGLQVQPAASGGSIEGTVVRGATSLEPIADARVELKPGNISTSADSRGAFRFQNVRPGEYSISVSHAGFVLLEDPRKGVTASGFKITVTDGQALRNIVLRMATAPVISGNVVGPEGQPLAAALVRAYIRQYTPYGTRMRVVKKGMTDDQGAFRLFGVPFGEYFVSGGYGDRERAEAVGKTQLSANVSPPDDGYITQFYDGTEELSYARPVRLRPDFDEGPVTIYLKEPARFRIRGQVVPQFAGVKIAIVPKGSDLAEASSFVQTGAGGTFEIRGVSPGTYCSWPRSQTSTERFRRKS